MDSLEALQQINILSSAILSNFNSITLKEYIEELLYTFSEKRQKRNKLQAYFRAVKYYSRL